MSVDAVHDRSICDVEAPVALRPIGTEGAVASGGESVVALALADDADTLPAASIALTTYVYAVDAVRPTSEYAVADAVPI